MRSKSLTKTSLFGLLLAASCTSAMAGEWRLEGLTGFGKLTASATLSIGADETVSGFAGCNRFFGAVVAEGGVQRIQLFGSTKKYCTDDRKRQQETAMLEAIRTSRTMRLDMGQLLFHAADGDTLMALRRR